MDTQHGEQLGLSQILGAGNPDTADHIFLGLVKVYLNRSARRLLGRGRKGDEGQKGTEQR